MSGSSIQAVCRAPAKGAGKRRWNMGGKRPGRRQAAPPGPALSGLENLTSDRDLRAVLGINARELTKRIIAGELPKPTKVIGPRRYWPTADLLAHFGVRLVPLEKGGRK